MLLDLSQRTQGRVSHWRLSHPFDNDWSSRQSKFRAENSRCCGKVALWHHDSAINAWEDCLTIDWDQPLEEIMDGWQVMMYGIWGPLALYNSRPQTQMNSIRCWCSYHCHSRNMFPHAKWIQVCVYNGIKCTANNWFFVYFSLSLSLPQIINSVRADLLSILFTTVVNAVVYHPFSPSGIRYSFPGCRMCCPLMAHSWVLPWALPCL